MINKKMIYKAVSKKDGYITEINIEGLPSGFKDLDYNLGYFKRQETYLIAARPGVGKTSFAKDLMKGLKKKYDANVLFDAEGGETIAYESGFSCAPDNFDIIVIDNADVSDSSFGMEFFKRKAVAFDCPVIVLMELDEKSDLRREKRENVTDPAFLRDLNFADNIIFMYRDDFYNKKSDEKGIVEFIIAKSTIGHPSTVRLGYKDTAEGKHYCDLDEIRRH